MKHFVPNIFSIIVYVQNSNNLLYIILYNNIKYLKSDIYFNVILTF